MDPIDQRCRSPRYVTASKVRVLIVHPHRLFGEALAVALAKYRPVLQVVGYVWDTSGLTPASFPPHQDPHVILVGSGDTGISLSQHIESRRRWNRQPTIVALTDGSLKDLVQSIFAVSRLPHKPGGKTSLIVRKAIQAARIQALTTREQQVYRLRYQGLSNKEVAVALQVGVQTVKNHMRTIVLKLQRSSQAFPEREGPDQ